MSAAAYRPRSIPVLAAGIAVGLMLTGCGGGDDDTAPAPTPESSAPESSSPVSSATSGGTDTVAWVDGFCGAINGFADDYNNLPAPPDSDTFEAIRESTSAQLGAVVAVLDKAIAALDALPPAPGSTAEAAARTATDNYTAARKTAATAKTELDAAPIDDVEAQSRAVDGMIAAQEQAHKSLDPVSALMDAPNLLDATADAPNCAP